MDPGAPFRRGSIDESVPARRPHWLGLALFCGIVPLVLGALCYLGLEATGAEGFRIAGLFVLLFGGILFVTGWIALVSYVASTPVVHASERRRRFLGALLAGALLAAQVPAVIFALGRVDDQRDVYRLRVENRSDAVVLGVVVWGKSISTRLGNVPPRDEVEFEIELVREETLHYEAAWRKDLLKGVLDDRAVRGSDVTLRVEKDGRTVILRSD